MRVARASSAVQSLTRKLEFEITFAQETLPAFNNVKVRMEFRCAKNNLEPAAWRAYFLLFADACGCE
jgi:hypothetical protein